MTAKDPGKVTAEDPVGEVITWSLSLWFPGSSWKLDVRTCSHAAEMKSLSERNAFPGPWKRGTPELSAERPQQLAEHPAAWQPQACGYHQAPGRRGKKTKTSASRKGGKT